MSTTLEQLAEKVGGTVLGDGLVVISDVASLPNSGRGQISYLASRKELKSLKNTKPAALFTTQSLADAAIEQDCRCSFVIVDDPQAAFIEAMLTFRPLPQRSTIGVSQQAIVSPTAHIGENCNVFPNAYIGENVTLGNRCEIHAGVVIQDGCVLGDDCVVYSNAVLYREVTLHDRVIIHANAVIGADGFGYRFVNGQFIKIPHTGSVVIENDVEVGACATIDRGMIESTRIGQGTKLDNMVQIAHNCQIGRHNAYASQVGLAGSCTTGDYVQMGGQAGVADHVEISDQVKVGAKAGVVGFLPPGQNFHGAPAINEKDAIRNHLNLQRLPELRNQVKQLTAQLAQLEEQMSRQSASPSARVA